MPWYSKIDPARLGVLPPVAPIDTTDVPDLADRVRGMLLGTANGDALGNRTESMLPAAREAEFGRITGYLPSRYANGHPAGVGA